MTAVYTGSDEIAAIVGRRRRRGSNLPEPSGFEITTEANNSPAFASITTEASAILITDN